MKLNNAVNAQDRLVKQYYKIQNYNIRYILNSLSRAFGHILAPHYILTLVVEYFSPGGELLPILSEKIFYTLTQIWTICQYFWFLMI